MQYFHVDAFTTRVFSGNPAAVVPLNHWPDEQTLQHIATENNLSETAFFLPTPGGPAQYHLRWFTPTLEMDLCGHATLATAHVLFHHLHHRGDSVTFDTRSGVLTVRKHHEGRLELDFPARPGRSVEVPDDLVRALGIRPAEVYVARDIMAVYESKKDVLALEPDMDRLSRLEGLGVIATAPATSHDYVSRFFAPRAGVPEDPVTGSAQCTLVPYWAERLGKKVLTSRQVSRRGGELWCSLEGERVRVAGHSVTYGTGEIHL